MALTGYNPLALPWLSIVNYPAREATPLEVALVSSKIRDHYCDFGPESLAIVLEQGIRFDKARTDLLVAVVYATMGYSREIRGWETFRHRVLETLISRGYKNLIG